MEEFEEARQEVPEEGENAPETSEEKVEDKKKASERIKEFLLKNKDVIILSGQLALVLAVCVAGIKNDLAPQDCRCKKCRKKKKKKRKK